MSIRDYDIEHVPHLVGPDGRAAFGSSPHNGYGRPLIGVRGRPLIQLSDEGLRDLRTAVITIFHEIAHHQSFRAVGHAGSEEQAERFGQRKYKQFERQWL